MSEVQKCPRPCVDCDDGLHHWLDAFVSEPSEHSGEPYFRCKHCEAATAMCEGCLEPVYPLREGETVFAALCNECREEGLGES